MLNGSQALFQPPVWLRNGHLQTIAANTMPRAPGIRALRRISQTVVIDTIDGDRLQIHWTQADRHRGSATSGDANPVLIVLHGLTGCADADNLRALATKASAEGFDALRVDLRSAQSDEPSTGIGHAGRSEDLRAVIDHVRQRKPGSPIAVIGFSLGGNITLKTAGEYGKDAPAELSAVAAVSAPIDLDDACRSIDLPSNFIYRKYFLLRLCRIYAGKNAAHPERYPSIDLGSIDSIRAWDNAVVAPLGGFANAEDYYRQCSALKVIAEIDLPTLLVQARDDPFIPFAPFQRQTVTNNHNVSVLASRHGGHTGFFAAAARNGEPDRFWGENRALDFCARAVGLSKSAPL